MLKTKQLTKVLLIVVFILSIMSFKSGSIYAHCDGLDGPVVLAAKKALETNNVNLVLIWVQQENEDEIKRVFDHTLAVRKLGPKAQQLADWYFFETLVRIHRAGEGAPYTGLKPAGRDLGPAIPAADKAVESGSAQEVLKLLTDAVHSGLHERFTQVMESKNYDINDVEAGRKFVKAYVGFVHYVEGIFNTAQKVVHGHAEIEQNQQHHEH